ncbi:hypothetical protein ABT009_24995 [Streptomyces sp. NPDC002896]|uniref:hypothetical protein n=1 Tax=Streptomyces sp. NPDC002896 TaxID=3154438 RepID=UPI003317C769
MSDEAVGLRAGMRLKSQVCTTQVIVVRAGNKPVVLWCGGVRMLELGASGRGEMTPVPEQMRGSLLGKRYTHPDDDSVEILVTMGGEGSMSDGEQDLVLKAAKPLPASD